MLELQKNRQQPGFLYIQQRKLVTNQTCKKYEVFLVKKKGGGEVAVEGRKGKKLRSKRALSSLFSTDLGQFVPL